jgi:ubiquitin
MQKYLETVEKVENEGAQNTDDDGLRDEDLRDRSEDVGTEEEAVEQDDHQSFQKRAESCKTGDKGRLFRIDLPRDNHGKVKDKDIEKRIEAENRTGQAIQKKPEYEREDASPERIEMESEIDYGNQGDLDADRAQRKKVQDRDLDNHQKQ